MAEPYTNHLGGTRVLAPGDYELFTANDQEHTIIRDVCVCNISGTPGSMQIYLQAGTNAIVLMRLPELAAGTSAQWQGRQVILPGWQLRVTSTCNDFSYIATGYTLTP